MIVFDLKCTAGHVFEAWFRSSDAFEDQRTGGKVYCPTCGDQGVVKAPMAPNIATGDRPSTPPQAAKNLPALTKAAPVQAAYVEEAMRAQMKRVLAEVKTHVEQNFDYVGKAFAEEARKIHYGEEETRPIYGEATREESTALRDEGIDFLEIPFSRKADA